MQLGTLPQQVEVNLALAVAGENVLPRVATLSHVVGDIYDFDPSQTSHGRPKYQKTSRLSPSLSTRCRRQRAFDFPRYRTVTRESDPPDHQNIHPAPWQDHHTRRVRITARIGGSPPAARPRHTPARPTPNPRLKEKLSEHPGNPSACPRPLPAPGSHALARPGRIAATASACWQRWGWSDFRVHGLCGSGNTRLKRREGHLANMTV